MVSGKDALTLERKRKAQKEKSKAAGADKLNKIDEYGIYETDKYVFFYANKCPFSNFYQPCSFLYEAFGEQRRFFTSEQAFMWHKAMFFGDKEMTNAILQASADPMECKQCGRFIRNYDDAKWSEVRYEVFRNVNYEKFSQDDWLRAFICQSKFEGKTFVEASPSDGIWGIRMAIDDPKISNKRNWRGSNLLGKCLTEVRGMILGEK